MICKCFVCEKTDFVIDLAAILNGRIDPNGFLGETRRAKTAPDQGRHLTGAGVRRPQGQSRKKKKKEKKEKKKEGNYE